MSFVKNNKEKIIKILVVLGLLYFFVFSHVMIVFKVVEDESEFYEITTKAITHGKSYIKFKSEVCPEDMDYFDIIDEAIEADMYSAGNFSGYTCRYTEDSDGVYHVTMKLSKPRRYRKFFARARAKKIAKCYSGLGSDYEKVKAVHDYIILYNEYFINFDGSYNAICTGHSACNGYALAFYQIMTELDIPVTIEAGDNHMWNTVFVDDEWYNIDLTWDDAGGKKVRYDYFLVDDNAFGDHAYGDSGAESSHAVTGRSASEYYKMVPNHKITRFIMLIIMVGCAVAVVNYFLVIVPKKKKEFKRRQEELLEQSLKNQEDMMKFDLDKELSDSEEREEEKHSNDNRDTIAFKLNRDTIAYKSSSETKDETFNYQSDFENYSK